MRLITVANGSINLHGVVHGEGPLILCVHGWPELSCSWPHQLAYFAEHGYTVAALETLPSWLSEADLQVYVDAFKKGGHARLLARYARNPSSRYSSMPGDALPVLLNVLNELLGEAVHGAELLGAQGLAQSLPAGAHPTLAVQHLVHGLARDKGLDIARAPAPWNSATSMLMRIPASDQHLVQSVLLGAAHPAYAKEWSVTAHVAPTEGTSQC